jgi:hypothetical protein
MQIHQDHQDGMSPLETHIDKYLLDTVYMKDNPRQIIFTTVATKNEYSSSSN